MSETLTLEKLNDVYMRVHCDSGTALELNEYFTFNVPGARHMPMFKNKVWDGKIRMFNVAARTLYVGLVTHVAKFAKERGYKIEYQDRNDFATLDFPLVSAKKFIMDLNLPIQPRDYQIDAFVYAIRNQRALMLSPTASGKSLIIYLIVKYLELKTLIVVPTTSLVHQMASDFASYGCDEHVHKIYEGQDKNTKDKIIVTTWQSIYKQPKSWFDQFSVLIGDEAHLYKAKSLTGILTKLDQCQFKLGFTGTLDGTQTHKLILEGLFGAVKHVTTTSELIDKKVLADFSIKAIVLSYDDQTRFDNKKLDYQDEINFIINNTKRNKFIVNLARSLNGNTLLLFKVISHGTNLFSDLVKLREDVYYVDGTVGGLDREELRSVVETKENAIIVASTGTFSTGINIKNLHNIIFAAPSKSRVKTLQSIGRGLRKSETKTSSVLYDIVDDIQYKSRQNFTLLHFAERVQMYNQEKFNYKIYTVKI
ncbi:MAG: DEAD/DEAH box helicase [Caulobacteraceae bacterium]|nr:DEAD/DEAH box helicase [Caulobacteraceae bacterium]